MKKLIKRQKGGFLGTLWGARFDKDGNYLGNSIFGSYKSKMGSFSGGKMNGSGAGGRFTLTPRYSNITFNEAFDAATEIGEPYFWYGEKLYNTNKELNPIREINNRYVGNSKERSKLKAEDSYDYQIGPIKIQGLSNIPIIQKPYKTGGRLIKKCQLGEVLENPQNNFSLEDYIALLIGTQRDIALYKSRNRKSVRIPLIPNPLSKRDHEAYYKLEIDYLNTRINEYTQKNDLTKVNEYKEKLQQILEKMNNYSSYMHGANCMYNAGDCYGLNIPGNMTFFDLHQNLGFKIIPYDEMLPGDIVQDTKHGVPGHAMIYDGNNRFNYAKGEYLGNDYNSKGEGTTLTGNYVTLGQYPLLKNYSIVYRYVGTPSDITRWTNEYNKLYK